MIKNINLILILTCFNTFEKLIFSKCTVATEYTDSKTEKHHGIIQVAKDL